MEDNTKLTISSNIDDIENRIVKSDDPNELRELVELWNVHLQKKELIRLGKLSELQDKLLDNVQERLDLFPEEWSNRGLTDTFKVIRDASNKTSSVFDETKAPSIQVNQINVGDTGNPELDRESRARISEVIGKILADSRRVDDNDNDE